MKMLAGTLFGSLVTVILLFGGTGQSLSEEKRQGNLGNGNTYQQFDTRLNWNAAKAACEGIGAHLVTIMNQSENSWVLSNMASAAASVWMGRTDQTQEGSWQWITGEPWNYENWNFGEPNDACDGEDCAEMYGQALGTWNDLGGPGCHGSMVRPYVCEWEGTCVTPSNWWPGDGNAKDIIGGQHGSVIGSVGFALGKVANAFSFNGNAYVSVADSPALTLGEDDFTL